MWNIVMVFMENKSGKLAKITETIAKNNIDLLLVDIADDGQFGVLRMLTDCPEKTRNILYNENYTVALNKVALVEIGDHPGELAKLAKVLEEEDINIKHAHGCIIERGKKAIFAISVDNPEVLEERLASKGIKIVVSL